jgi:hypothetical protein
MLRGHGVTVEIALDGRAMTLRHRARMVGFVAVP